MRPHKSDLLDDAREIVFRRIAAENGTAEPRVKAAPPVGESGREDFVAAAVCVFSSLVVLVWCVAAR